MRKRLATGLVVLAVLASACGKDDKKDSGTLPSDTTAVKASGPQTLPISVDHKTEPFAVSWIHFFPAKVTARPGDTIEFTGAFTGANHTVMGGTLVQEFAAAAKKAGPNHDGPPPPELEAFFKKVPPTFNEDGKPGEEFLAQAGNQPCFSATEDPPTKDACSKEQQKLPDTFTGKERFINSGFLADEDTFKVTLADDIAPGTYTFACAVHGPDMSEDVTVVPKGTDIDTSDEVKAAGEKELAGYVAKFKATADKVSTNTNPKEASAGAQYEEKDGVPNEGINVFPTELAIKKGESVTWTSNGFHSISFNAPEDARPWIIKNDDGSVKSNPKTFAPSNSPKIPDPPKPPGGGDQGGGPPDGPPPQVKVDGGKFDGKAFVSSGIPLSEAQLVYSLTFTEAGTFTYKCLVHPDMEGTVKVT